MLQCEFDNFITVTVRSLVCLDEVLAVGGDDTSATEVYIDPLGTWATVESYPYGMG